MAFSCVYCEKIFKIQSDFNKHLQVAHHVEQHGPSRSSFVGVACSSCDKIFTHQSNLNRHLKTVHQVGKRNIVSYEFNAFINKCSECGVSYVNIEQLRQHLTDFHLNAFPEESFQFNNTEGKLFVDFYICWVF